jgi:O-antigen/teichoic acid export membrane protein
MTLAARILMAAGSVAAGALIARILGAESLGIYLVLSSASQILVQFASFSLHIGNTFYTAREPHKMIPAAVNSAIFGVAAGTLSAATVILLSAKLLPGVPNDLVMIVLLSVPFQIITGYVINLFLAHGEVRRFNLIDLVNQSFIFINAAFVLLVVGGGLALLVSLNTAAAALVAIGSAAAFVWFARDRFPEAAWRGDASLFAKTIAYSGKGFVLWFSTYLVYRIDLIIMNAYRGSAESAVYAVATQCTMFLLLLPHAVSHLLQAKVSASEDDGGEFTAKVGRNTSLLLAGACVVSIPGIYIVQAIYGSEFGDLPVQFWILLPGIFFVGMQSVIAQYFVGTGLPKVIPMIWVATLALNIVGNVIFIPIYGGRGAAAVSTACYFMIFVFVLGLFLKRTGIPLADVLIPNMAELKGVVDRK